MRKAILYRRFLADILARDGTGFFVVLAVCGLTAYATAGFGQVPVEALSDPRTMLSSPDPLLARNKRLVFDFWREVLEAGHLELTGKYLAEGYIQHDPIVPTGRAAFIKHFKTTHRLEVRPIDQTIRQPLVCIIAERDLVSLTFVYALPRKDDPSRIYTTTRTDLFRIADGKIVEHWDSHVIN